MLAFLGLFIQCLLKFFFSHFLLLKLFLQRGYFFRVWFGLLFYFLNLWFLLLRGLYFALPLLFVLEPNSWRQVENDFLQWLLHCASKHLLYLWFTRTAPHFCIFLLGFLDYRPNVIFLLLYNQYNPILLNRFQNHQPFLALIHSHSYFHRINQSIQQPINDIQQKRQNIDV